MVYPVPGREKLDMDDPRLVTGKFEPLVHLNAILSEEVQRAMAESAGDHSPVVRVESKAGVFPNAASPPMGVSQFSLLSGALSKCLCCILHHLQCWMTEMYCTALLCTLTLVRYPAMC